MAKTTRKTNAKSPPRLERFTGNPVITPVPEHSWESKATFNPAALYDSGKVHILYRAIGDNDTSTLGYAASTDGFHIEKRLDEPAYVPRESFEGVRPSGRHTGATFPDPGDADGDYVSGGGAWGGCEDPRLTRIGNRIYLTYIAYDGSGPPRVALSSIQADDFNAAVWNWERPVLISPPGIVDKNACILPETIESKYVIFHRVFPDILIDFVDSLVFDGTTKWLKGDYRIAPRDVPYWDSRKLGIGPTPLKTREGWLVIYQGVGETEPDRYKIGAMLLDLKNPARVIGRLKEPLLEPDAPYENEGWKSGVVYPCGATLINGKLLVYYGGADMVTCVASMKLDTLLNALQ